MIWLAVAVSAIIYYSSCKGTSATDTKLDEARRYINFLNEKFCERRFERTIADFNYQSNMTADNYEKMINVDALPFIEPVDIMEFDWDSFNDPYLKRQAKFFCLLNMPVDPKLLKEVKNNINDMINASLIPVNICAYKNPNICGEKVWDMMFEALQLSNDTEEMKFYWQQNHEGAPRNVRPLYKRHMELSNMVAVAKNFSNAAEEWLDEYDDPPMENFEKLVYDLYDQIKPLYSQFHSYVRNKLRRKFGENVVSKRGPIPIHLFSFNNGDSLGFAIDYLKPFPEKSNLEITKSLVQQNYTVMKIVQMVEDYYTSMGLEPLPEDFWKNSIFETPTDRLVTNDQLSFDFCNKKYYRMIVSASVDYSSALDCMHEMGHLHNFYAYRDQPCCFRSPPNSGHSEAIAGTMIVPFMSFKNLKRLGFIEESDKDKEVELNLLFEQFVQSVGLMPVVLVNDLWRWSIFRNEVSEANYNQAFWDLRLKYQGVVPPFKRSEEYLDPAIRAHLLDGSPTISYFLMFIIQYQHHEALCTIAGEYDPNNPHVNPLHNCDLYGSKKAGTLWNNMLKMGSSESWISCIKAMTGSNKLSTESLLKYFEPFHKWLIEENKKNNEYIGWE